MTSDDDALDCFNGLLRRAGALPYKLAPLTNAYMFFGSSDSPQGLLIGRLRIHVRLALVCLVYRSNESLTPRVTTVEAKANIIHKLQLKFSDLLHPHTRLDCVSKTACLQSYMIRWVARIFVSQVWSYDKCNRKRG